MFAIAIGRETATSVHRISQLADGNEDWAKLRLVASAIWLEAAGWDCCFGRRN